MDTIRIAEIPVADFELTETTTKSHGSGHGHLQLNLCKADFDYLMGHKFRCVITVRNLATNSGYGRKERVANRIKRIINEQNGCCEIVCNTKRRNRNSRISSIIGNPMVSRDEKLVRFDVLPR